ncbi:MAG TPA: hypothetical protein VGL61_28775 [Kofleriaceae bacterium]|jgi:hypothetical protein
MRAAFVIPIALFACKREEAPAAPPAPAVARIADAAVDAPAADAPVDAPPPIALPAKSSGWIDSPRWPAGNRVELAWLVYPTVPRVYQGMGDTMVAPLQLVATIGSVSRVVTFDPQLGSLKLYFQSACGSDGLPPERNEIAKLVFEEGGFGGELVRRDGDGVVEILDWSQSDGACPDAHGQPAACKPHEKLVARMHVPHGATFTQAIYDVDDAGARHPFDCSH